MRNLRKHDSAPFDVAVLHGGPGAAGEMRTVAQHLARNHGVLEPLQTEKSVDGQVQELRETLEQNGDVPAVCVGWSWGAWLGYLLAARHPSLLRKLILVGSGPFEDTYAQQIRETQDQRLSEEDRLRLREVREQLHDSAISDKQLLFEELGKTFDKVDAYDPIDEPADDAEIRYDIYKGVWPEAAELRRSGKLLELAGSITCPVVAIHGDYDLRPAEGVREPLSQAIKDFRFILLRQCGHRPWLERKARAEFYGVLEEEVSI